MKILIVRLSAMGDVIHAMPAVAGLRREFPDSRIDWAIEERWSPLLTARGIPDSIGSDAPSAEQPLANLVHRVRMRSWRQSPFSPQTRCEIRALWSRLHDIEYDHAIDLQGAIRSALLAKASGAKVRAGARDPRELPARWWYNVKAHTPARHVVDQAAEIVSRALGRSITPAVPPFPVSTEAESWTEKLLAGDLTQFVLFNPGAGWGAKCWPAERYAAVVRSLAAHGMKCFINAGPGELELAQQVRRNNQHSSQVVECTLLQLISLTRRASLFVGGDTGPLHLASAMSIPVVAIFGPTDPARNGPYGGGRYVVLRSPESKRDHRRHREPEPGLLNITVDQVTEAALSLLRVPA